MSKDTSTKILSGIDLSAGNKILSTAEADSKYLVVTTGHATNAIIAPCVADMNFIVVNQDGVNVAIIKVAGMTGVTVAASAEDNVYCNGTDYVLITGAAAEVTVGDNQTLANKTLTTPVIASLYQDAAKSKLMTVPAVASDTLVTLAANQTLTTKTLTSPVLNTGISGTAIASGAEIVTGTSNTKIVTPLAVADSLAANRCQYSFAGTIDISIGSSGIIPFPTRVGNDAGLLMPWTNLATGACDTNTSKHCIDADSTDFTTINAILAPALFPIRQAAGSTWAIADAVAAHDITLSKDIFPNGTETYDIFDPTVHIAATGLYLVDVKIALGASEEHAYYTIEIVKGIAAPAVIGTSKIHSDAITTKTLSFTGILSLTAADRIYVKLTHNGQSALTVGASQLSVVKL